MSQTKLFTEGLFPYFIESFEFFSFGFFQPIDNAGTMVPHDIFTAQQITDSKAFIDAEVASWTEAKIQATIDNNVVNFLKVYPTKTDDEVRPLIEAGIRAKVAARIVTLGENKASFDNYTGQSLSFYHCNMINTMPPPGSIVTLCNTAIISRNHEVPAKNISVVIDGVPVEQKRYENRVYGLVNQSTFDIEYKPSIEHQLLRVR